MKKLPELSQSTIDSFKEIRERISATVEKQPKVSLEEARNQVRRICTCARQSGKTGMKTQES